MTGLTPDRAYPSPLGDGLTEAQAEEALAFYETHQAEVDGAVEAEQTLEGACV